MAKKTEIIAEFVAANPTATWKDAEATLSKKGISANYFATQRSKLNSGGGKKKPKTAAAKATTAKINKPGPKPAAATGHALVDAAQFAKKAGGLAKAKALLSDLEAVQL